MGVIKLWQALDRGGAVESLEGHHAHIVEAVENKVVAVDLSAWIMQAQSQPAMLEHYDSPYARAVKIVFDRTIHWLRYGCLPVFVIEGRTPEAKLDKLRARCVAQYGPSRYNVGNREGGQFDRLGQAVRRLLDALGVPCVQAVGEAEAMCAALNVCGWAHAVHTADVDALLFGALTVYSKMHLQTDDPRRSKLKRCCMYDVRRVLGISRGGDAALMAVAHLAGGDYDLGGADNVGEALALGAVRQLLAGCEDDEGVLQKLEAAIGRGPDPELDALTKCTGCKACGHEGNRKSRINTHSAKNGCEACGVEGGCTTREFTECACAFHARADERLLNRVVRRAVGTPNFMASFKTAASAYAEQTRSAIAAVQREYGLPAPGSGRNVFSWSRRPDVRAVSGIMCGYIKEWDYRQVRLKLLPLLLEWDVRQGPSPGPSLRPLVQFRPSSIRKVSSKGVEATELVGVPARQQQGWRYVLLVERLPSAAAAGAGASSLAAAAAPEGGSSGGAAAAAAGEGAAEGDEAEDLAIDQSWIAGTARSRPPKQSPPSAAALSTAAAGAGGEQQRGRLDGLDLLGGDGDDTYEGEPFLATQMPATQGAGLGSPLAARTLSNSGSQQQSPLGARAAAAGSSQQGGAARGASGGGAGSLQFAEHRSVRCSLIDAVWPHLTAAFRQPAGSSGRVRSAGASRKKPGAAAGAATADEEKQRSVKDFYNVVKDYTASGRQAVKQPAAAAADSESIPGLAGLSAGITSIVRGTAVAAAATTKAAAPQAGGPGASGRPAAGGVGSPAARAPQQSFMEWLQQEQQGPQCDREQQQPGSSLAQPQQQQQHQQPQQQHQHQHQQRQHKPSSGAARRVFSSTQSTQAAAGVGGAGSGSSRARKKQAAPKTPVKAGPLDRFLRPAAAASFHPAAAAAAGAAGNHTQQASGVQQEQVQLQGQDSSTQQQQQQHPDDGCCDLDQSPEVPSLAARLAAAKVKAAAGGCCGAAGGRPSPSTRSTRQRPVSADSGGAAGEGGPARSTGAPPALHAPPAKRVSTPQAKELLGSPATQTAAAADGAAAAGSSQYNSQYESLLLQMGVASPEEEQRVPARPTSSRIAKGLFNVAVAAKQQQQQQQQTECIELLDSPTPGASAARSQGVEVVDLT